jgi:hypothetical protein
LAITRLSNSPALQLFVRVLLTYLSDKPRRRTSPAAAGSALLDQMFDSIITGSTPNARRAFIQYTQGAEPVAPRASSIRAKS